MSTPQEKLAVLSEKRQSLQVAIKKVDTTNVDEFQLADLRLRLDDVNDEIRVLVEAHRLEQAKIEAKAAKAREKRERLGRIELSKAKDNLVRAAKMFEKDLGKLELSFKTFIAMTDECSRSRSRAGIGKMDRLGTTRGSLLSYVVSNQAPEFSSLVGLQRPIGSSKAINLAEMCQAVDT